MPELETRFAELPDWLKSNNPPAPTWLQRQQEGRLQRQDRRQELESELRRRRDEQDLKKAVLDYSIEDQNRELEVNADKALATVTPQMNEALQKQDVFGAWNILSQEVVKNPMITRSKQFSSMMNMLGVSYGFTELRARVDQAQARAEAANQQRILSNQENQARMAELRAGIAEQGGKSDEVNRRFLFQKQSARIQKQIDVIDKDLTLSNEEKARRKAPLLRQQTALEFAFDKGQDLVDALDSMEAPAPAPEMDENEQIFSDWRKAIARMAITGETEGSLQPDGTVKNTWYGDKKPAELLKEVEAKEAAYRAMKSGVAPQTDTRTPPQDPRMGGLPIRDFVPSKQEYTRPK